MSSIPPKRASTPWGRVAHAYVELNLPAAAVCGARVTEPWPVRHASGEFRHEYWGADPDACKKCLRQLRKGSR